MQKHQITSPVMSTILKNTTPTYVPLTNKDWKWIAFLRWWVHCTDTYCPIPSSSPGYPFLGYLSQDFVPCLKFAWQSSSMQRSDPAFWKLLEPSFDPSSSLECVEIPSKLCPFFRYMSERDGEQGTTNDEDGKPKIKVNAKVVADHVVDKVVWIIMFLLQRSARM